MDDTRIPWLFLIRIPGTGPVQQKKLIDIFGSAEKIFGAPHSELAGLGFKSPALDYLASPPLADIKSDLKWLEHPDHHLVTIADNVYPPQLLQISDAPVVLFVQGDPAMLNDQQIGIVGSRNPTAGGRKTTLKLAAELSVAGLTITSGLALGIDYCGHLGALNANGRTIAVMGNGLDRIYPARHKDIAALIAASGALVSEFPPGTPPLPNHFPRRNRIISGLSLGIIVVEAAPQSGSLITARYALEQGREVFAVPGSIYNPLSQGCHHLIKQGAKLTESVHDILEELNFTVEIPGAISGSQADSAVVDNHQYDIEVQHLLEHLSYDPVSIDKLIEFSGLTADAVSSMLLVLEIQGLVSSAGGLYTRI